MDARHAIATAFALVAAAALISPSFAAEVKAPVPCEKESQTSGQKMVPAPQKFPESLRPIAPEKSKRRPMPGLPKPLIF